MVQHKYGFICTALAAISAIVPIRCNAAALDDALRATYTACVGIDDELADLKKMAGINTAVTAVGTATGTGATVVGMVKASKDKEVAVKLEKLRQIEQQNPQTNVSDWVGFSNELQTKLTEAKDEIARYQAEIEKLTKQSKSLGNWRTGLVAGATTTNIAGAIIAGTGQSTRDLRAMIADCRAATEKLRQSIGQARVNGLDVSEAQTIIEACSEYDYIDVSKIDNRGRGAMISSVVGATTGTAGTIASAIANKDNDANKKKERDLNTAANVLSGATAAASATATIFNATQISAIKKVSAVAEKCTGALK